MKRFKEYDLSKKISITTCFEEQILPGTFEYTIHVLIEHLLDISSFEDRYKNDRTGAPAYSPKNLLKAILLAYSRGILSSRKISYCCSKNVVFMALTGSMKPHFTTIADFISSTDKEVTDLYTKVLLICQKQKLLDRTFFALDGCKLSSNASKEKSGTKEDFQKKVAKLKEQIARLVEKHKAIDRHESVSGMVDRDYKCIENLCKQVDKIEAWLGANDDKIGYLGKPIKSNITDNESAKMKSAHGYIQGYNGVAMVDAKHQVIVHAEAFGQAQEHGLLAPMLDSTITNFHSIGLDHNVFDRAKFACDAGFHHEKNMEMLFERGIDAYVADNQFRKRDPLYADSGRYKVRHRSEKSKRKSSARLFRPKDFHYNKEKMTCTCPAGKPMYLKNKNFEVNGNKAISFIGWKTNCRSCDLRKHCLQKPDKTEARQVYFFYGHTKEAAHPYTEQMKKKIDTVVGKSNYGRRLAIVEPVFADICWASGMNRFTLRGKRKVDAQWKLYCMVHNIKKIRRYGEGFA